MSLAKPLTIPLAAGTRVFGIAPTLLQGRGNCMLGTPEWQAWRRDAIRLDERIAIRDMAGCGVELNREPSRQASVAFVRINGGCNV